MLDELFFLPRFQNHHPGVVWLVVAALLSGLMVVPWMNSRPFWPTPSKWAALLIVAGCCAYLGSMVPALILLWPLSLIWFPEHWGNFTGFLQGRYVDQTSPPLAVAAMGWLFLIAIPLSYLLMIRQ